MQEESKRGIKYVALLLGIVLLIALSFLFGVNYERMHWSSLPKQIDTVWRDTTIYVPGECLVPSEPELVHDTIKVPADTVYVPGDTIKLTKTQIKYSSKDVDVWVSGVEPKVDSLKVNFTYPEITTSTIKEYTIKYSIFLESQFLYNTNYNTGVGIGAQYHDGRWTYSLSAGYGVSTIPAEQGFNLVPSPYIKATVKFNLFSW